MITRGDIYWHEPPHESARPVLVLSRQTGVDVMAKVLAVPTTTTIRGIPTEVHLDGDDGMPEECVLSLDNLAPVFKSHLTRRITSLGTPRMVEVCRALTDATDC